MYPATSSSSGTRRLLSAASAWDTGGRGGWEGREGAGVSLATGFVESQRSSKREVVGLTARATANISVDSNGRPPDPT